MSAQIGDNRVIMTVLGEQPPDWPGPVDAHSHVWIASVPGAAAGSPVLDQAEFILKEMNDYRLKGGAGIIDCQPAGCGRDANRLVWLARGSNVRIVGCTGFHRRRYYQAGAPIWKKDTPGLADYFTSEILIGMQETLASQQVARAGFIKVAIEGSLEETPQAALEAAAVTAARTGAAIEVHTEKGAAAEHVFEYFTDKGVQPGKVILCHVDKRPDFGLHSELAQAGALLEYDTFYRPKYDPERNLWPLIQRMVAAGWDRCLALATDLAEADQWQRLGSGPGPAGFLVIRDRLFAEGISQESVARLTGKNITERLRKPKLE